MLSYRGKTDNFNKITKTYLNVGKIMRSKRYWSRFIYKF